MQEHSRPEHSRQEHPDLALLRELSAWRSSPVATLFVPIDPAHRDVDRVALKAMLQQASRELGEDVGIDWSAAMLPPASATVPWRTMVWFLAPGRTAITHLPEQVGPEMVLGSVPHVLGVLPWLDNGPEYLVLALSQHHVRLFSAGRYHIEALKVPDLPTRLEDALWFVRREPTFQRHGSGAMHASGGGTQWHKEDVRRFVQLVDDALENARAAANDDSAGSVSDRPLVVVGVGYEAAMFRDVHGEAVVLEANPDHWTESQLHQRTWPVMRVLPGPAQVAAARVAARAGTGTALLDPAEIRSAAEEGAVGELLVARSATGVPDLDEAVLAAVAAGAVVWSVGADELPTGAVAAALLRR